jgi:hypothetical protein
VKRFPAAAKKPAEAALNDNNTLPGNQRSGTCVARFDRTFAHIELHN